MNAPAGTREIDVTGKTILPGWIDVHDHPIGQLSAYAWPLPGRELATLAYGTTTIRDPSSTSGFTSLADDTDAGVRIGPRTFSTARALLPGDFSGAIAEQEIFDRVREHAVYWRTETLKQYNTGGRRVRQWVASAAREYRLTPTNEGRHFFDNLTMILDGYSSIEHGMGVTPVYDDVLQLLSRSDLIWTPTLMVQESRSDTATLAYRYFQETNPWASARYRRFVATNPGDNAPSADQNGNAFARSVANDVAHDVALGGRAALGSHGNIPGLGVHWELLELSRGGMRTFDVLRAGTIWAAEAIGHAQDIGSIEPGKLADLQVLDANPLENIHNTLSIRYVMRNGFLYDADTLNEIWPESVTLESPWWTSEPSPVLH